MFGGVILLTITVVFFFSGNDDKEDNVPGNGSAVEKQAAKTRNSSRRPSEERRTVHGQPPRKTQQMDGESHGNLFTSTSLGSASDPSKQYSSFKLSKFYLGSEAEGNKTKKVIDP